MKVFVDTSGLYALINPDDRNHELARSIWVRLVEGDDLLITTNYVVVEALTLIQRRLGMGAASRFQKLFPPALEVEWVDERLHRNGVAALLTANRRDLSLVDCVSFSVCRRAGVDGVFAFDDHFAEQGFALLRAQP